MNLAQLKQSLSEYIEHLTLYDYAAYGWLLFLFVIVLILALVVSKKRPILSIILILFSVISIFIAPFGIKYFLDNSVRKSVIIDKNVTKFNFKDVLVVTGSVKNSGKIDFQKCSVHAKIIKYHKNSIKDFLSKFKPLKIKSILLDEEIKKNEQKKFKIVFENFKYSGEYNVTVDAECY